MSDFATITLIVAVGHFAVQNSYPKTFLGVVGKTFSQIVEKSGDVAIILDTLKKPLDFSCVVCTVLNQSHA